MNLFTAAKYRRINLRKKTKNQYLLKPKGKTVSKRESQMCQTMCKESKFNGKSKLFDGLMDLMAVTVDSLERDLLINKGCKYRCLFYGLNPGSQVC
jgi:hypothetical protein